MNITHVFRVLMVMKVLFLAETINAYNQVRDMALYRSTLGTNHTAWATSICCAQFSSHWAGTTGKEQLDLSVALNNSYKLPEPDPFASENPYCTHFLQSYTGFNGTMNCHDVPPFTCQRLWINRGLPAVSQLPSVKSTMSSSFICQTNPLPTHSAMPVGSSSAKVTVRSSSSVPALPSTTSKPSSTSSPTNLSTVTAAPLQTVIQSVLVVLSPETTYTTTYYSTL